MTRRLPPLNALRAFEAAARRGGFAKAAGELAVTLAAVSQQVRLLEAELGVELFRRLPRGLELTPAGRGALPELREAFARLARAVEDMRGERLAGPLAVSVPPSPPHRWLLPRPAGARGRPPGDRPHGPRRGPRRGPRPRGDRPRRPLRQGPLPGPARPAAADRGGVPGLRAGARARRAAAAAPAGRPAGAHAAARVGERGAVALLVGLAGGRGRGPRPGARA